MKNIILQRKLTPFWAGLILYLTFCIANFYMARGMWGYANSMYGLEESILVSNVVIAFFAGGVVPFAFFEIISGFVTNSLYRTFGKNTLNFRYSLRFFFGAANILTGLISLLYLISPLISVYGIIFAPIISAFIFMPLYLMFVCRNYVEKPQISQVVFSLGGLIIIIYTLMTVLSILGLVI